jgi:N-acyl-L-homoserine lactone synthetase
MEQAYRLRYQVFVEEMGWTDHAKPEGREIDQFDDPIWLLRLVQLHFRTMPLGLPRLIGGEDTIAVTATFDWRTLNRLREMRGTRKMVLAEALEKPVLLHA